MIFHLVWNKRCDNFVAFQLKQQNIEEVFDVVSLYATVHPTSKVASLNADSSSSSSSESDDDESSLGSKLELLKTYIKADSLQETKLNIALESLLEQRSNQVSNFPYF